MVESHSALCYCRRACQECAGTGKSGPDGTYAGSAAQAGEVIARVPRKYTVGLPNVCNRLPIHNRPYNAINPQHVVWQSAEAQPLRRSCMWTMLHLA